MSQDFSITHNELVERAEQLRMRMSAAGMDALLVTAGDNLKYTSGYPSPLRSGPRPFLFLLPLSGEPVFIVHSGREGEARRFSWAEDIRTYYRLSHLPVELLIEVLREKGLEKSRIGIEIGAEQCMDIPLADFFGVQKAFPKINFVDSAPVLWGARMHKTAREIERIRRACAVTSSGYETCYAEFRQGMTERTAAQRMRDCMLSQGADDTWLLMTSGEGNYDLVSRGPSERQLQKGDFLYVDCGCSIAGYWCDFDRVGVVGKPSREQAEAQRIAEEITQMGVSMVRPGVPVREIALHCAAALKHFPYPITSDIGYLAARIGHGVGVTAIEPPNIADYDETILEPGMIITIEPGVATTFGVFHVEQNVLITESGHEVLSTAPTGLHTIHG